MFSGEYLLFICSLAILFAGAFLTIHSRFVQFRKIPEMVKLFFSRGKAGSETVDARRALFTVMSTTLGMSTLVSPVIAIRLGGPGALVGFFIATILGAAVSFTEVTLALSYRKRGEQGIVGGPMPYLSEGIHPWMGKIYAFFCFLLMMVWSAANANQLGLILHAPMLGHFAIPPWVTGLILAGLVLIILVGGIKRIASFSARLVPVMFLLYVGASLWIILTHLELLPGIFRLVIDSCLHPQAFGTGFVVGGMTSALRWGIFKGLQSNEAGIGTQTIPHSMAETKTPIDQGVLSMVSTYAAGFLCLISGVVTLMTQTWLRTDLSLGLEMVATSFAAVFSVGGIIIVIVSSLLFAFGTILGNGYNGLQCFTYLTKGRGMNLYYFATAVLIFLGTIGDVKFVWSVIDYFLLPVALPHILAVVWLAYRRRDLLAESAPVL